MIMLSTLDHLVDKYLPPVHTGCKKCSSPPTLRQIAKKLGGQASLNAKVWLATAKSQFDGMPLLVLLLRVTWLIIKFGFTLALLTIRIELAILTYLHRRLSKLCPKLTASVEYLYTGIANMPGVVAIISGIIDLVALLTRRVHRAAPECVLHYVQEAKIDSDLARGVQDVAEMLPDPYQSQLRRYQSEMRHYYAAPAS